MSASPREAIDYGRFAERLAAQRANQDPAKRWDLYQEFHREWGFDPEGAERWNDGEPVYRDGDDRLVPAERIPAALREWWKLPENSFADRRVKHGMQHDWPPEWITAPPGNGDVEALAPDSPLVVDPDDLRMCSVVIENQGCAYWGYQSAEAHLDDPRAYVLATEEGWEVQADSLSEFALLVAVRTLLFSFGWMAENWDDDFDAVADRIRATMPELGFRVWRELASEIVFHGGPDTVAWVDPTGEGDQLYLFGRTREAPERQTADLGGEWKISPPPVPSE
ncbi:hypothetical protein ABH926_000048 [Catenulispora sp. GP43]|uniref:hypothetical protein n=1 Tax=Catenulispora sp. GP43 TaxID=3156263 RepID=UPI003518FC79